MLLVWPTSKIRSTLTTLFPYFMICLWALEWMVLYQIGLSVLPVQSCLLWYILWLRFAKLSALTCTFSCWPAPAFVAQWTVFSLIMLQAVFILKFTVARNSFPENTLRSKDHDMAPWISSAAGILQAGRTLRIGWHIDQDWNVTLSDYPLIECF